MYRRLIPALLLLAAVPLVGCTAPTNGGLPAPFAEAYPPDPAVAEEDLSAEELEAYGVEPATVILGFGESHTFPDGVVVSVSVSRFEGNYDGPFVYGGGPLVQVQTTVENGSGQPVESPSAVVGVTSNGSPVNNILGYNHPALSKGGGQQLPGQSQTFDGLYEVANVGAEIVVEVRSPTSPYEPGSVFFRGVPN